MPDSTPRPSWLPRLLSSAAALFVSACQLTPPAGLGSPEPDGVIGPRAGARGSARSSVAASPRAYRQDGASHLYDLHADRIYKGRMPPQLYAIGVMNVEIDRAGRVTRLNWVRAPRHAPQVMAEIERMIRQASPFPAPARLGKVVYTDTWLWDKSGKFQLDTLTEGQN